MIGGGREILFCLMLFIQMHDLKRDLVVLVGLMLAAA